MDQTNRVVLALMKALREADPELAHFVDSLKDQNVDDRVRTFEDCARVEQDIMSKLNSIINPFQ